VELDKKNKKIRIQWGQIMGENTGQIVMTTLIIASVGIFC